MKLDWVPELWREKHDDYVSLWVEEAFGGEVPAAQPGPLPPGPTS